MTEEPRRSGASGPSTRGVEIFIALFTFALGAIMVFDSWRLGAGWAFDGPQPGYFPFYIGLLICFGSLVNVVTAIIGKHTQSGVFVEWPRFRQVLAMLVPAALFVGVIPVVGIYVATPVYLAGFMIWLGRYAWYQGVGVGLGTSAFFFLMFEVWFKVPLPKGAYDFLRLFGY